MTQRHTARRTLPASGAVLAAALLALGGLSGCSKEGTTAATAGSASPLACGMQSGKKASGTPIVLGGLSTDVPGLVFTDSTTAAGAYFACVNDNGGINGHPVKYVTYHDVLDPAQTGALTAKLVNQDKVLAFVGSNSILDCIVNAKMYQEAGFQVIGSATPTECFSVANFSPVNGGALTNVAAAQILVEKGAKKIVSVMNAGPGSDIVLKGVEQFGEIVKIPVVSVTEPVPLTDANGLALSLVQKAGADGGIVLGFGSDQAIQILAAAAQQGLIDKAKWACNGACSSAEVAAAIGAQWNGKFFAPAELALTTADTPDVKLYRDVMARYAPGAKLNGFGESGFISAKIAVAAMLKLPEDQLTKEGINKAFAAVVNFESDLFCEPWSFGTGNYHLNNNSERGIVVKDGKWVDDMKCFPVAPVPLYHLREIRASLGQKG